MRNEVKSGTGERVSAIWLVLNSSLASPRAAPVPEAGVSLLLWLFVIPQDADHAAQRLNPLAGKGSIYFGPDGVGGLVAKLLRSERLNVLCGGWGRAPGYDPLQRDEEDPIHICFPPEVLRANLSGVSETGSIHESPPHHSLSDRLRRYYPFRRWHSSAPVELGSHGVSRAAVRWSGDRHA